MLVAPPDLTEEAKNKKQSVSSEPQWICDYLRPRNHWNHPIRRLLSGIIALHFGRVKIEDATAQILGCSRCVHSAAKTRGGQGLTAQSQDQSS